MASNKEIAQSIVLFLGEHGVDLLGRGPGCGAVLLAVPATALVGGNVGKSHDISSRAGQNGEQAVLCPSDLEGVFHCRRQIGNDVREAAAQGLGNEQRRPDNRNIEEQVNGEFACLVGLLQIIITSKKPPCAEAQGGQILLFDLFLLLLLGATLS